MNNQRKKRTEMFDVMKACIHQQLGLPVLDEANEEGSLGIHSEVDSEYFLASVHTSLSEDLSMVKIRIVFDPPINQENVGKVQDLLNRINTQLMDIGTYTVCNGGVVSMRTAIPITGDHFPTDQFRESFKRFLSQGRDLYGIVLRADLDDASPETIMRDFFKWVRAFKRNPNIGTSIKNETVH